MELFNSKHVFKQTKKKNGEIAIQQTESRTLKGEILQQLNALIASTYDIEVIRTGEGLIILLPNDELGAIPIALDVKIKSLDFDYLASQAQYQEKLQAKEEKEKAKQK